MSKNNILSQRNRIVNFIEQKRLREAFVELKHISDGAFFKILIGIFISEFGEVIDYNVVKAYKPLGHGSADRYRNKAL